MYSALILADDDIAVTGEKIQPMLKAVNVDVDVDVKKDRLQNKFPKKKIFS